MTAILRTMAATLASVRELEQPIEEHCGQHPDAEILRSLPGLGGVLGARVLSEFGDDPTRFPDAASRRAYAGSAPITRASGKAKIVLLRRAYNRRLSTTCRWWAFIATERSPQAKAFYQRRRDAGDSYEAPLRQLASKLLGQLHYCLSHHELYDEHKAWPATDQSAEHAAYPTADTTACRIIVANNGSAAGGSRAAAGRRAAMRSTLEATARDPHNSATTGSGNHRIDRNAREVSRGTPRACRDEITASRCSLISEAAAGFGRSPR